MKPGYKLNKALFFVELQDLHVALLFSRHYWTLATDLPSVKMLLFHYFFPAWEILCFTQVIINAIAWTVQNWSVFVTSSLFIAWMAAVK